MAWSHLRSLHRIPKVARLSAVFIHLQLKFFLGISLHQHWHISTTLYRLAVRIMHGEGDWREAAMGAAWLTILLTMKHLGKTQRYTLGCSFSLYMGLLFFWLPHAMELSCITVGLASRSHWSPSMSPPHAMWLGQFTGLGVTAAQDALQVAPFQCAQRMAKSVSSCHDIRFHEHGGLQLDLHRASFACSVQG